MLPHGVDGYDPPGEPVDLTLGVHLAIFSERFRIEVAASEVVARRSLRVGLGDPR